ncbi:hypothetical protein K7X08_021354 [Anisodus acutangulus]|uniref:Uncharacterized protein n=1 Tax=Anisodus acutangulus TaxID=402998 RepID=A0A9Q1R907_9SOLA|nr:hypothetical protein K7X08_021354 [Anisodus acutangulus]
MYFLSSLSGNSIRVVWVVVSPPSLLLSRPFLVLVELVGPLLVLGLELGEWDIEVDEGFVLGVVSMGGKEFSLISSGGVKNDPVPPMTGVGAVDTTAVLHTPNGVD